MTIPFNRVQNFIDGKTLNFVKSIIRQHQSAFSVDISATDVVSGEEVWKRNNTNLFFV